MNKKINAKPMSYVYPAFYCGLSEDEVSDFKAFTLVCDLQWNILAKIIVR